MLSFRNHHFWKSYDSKGFLSTFSYFTNSTKRVSFFYFASIFMTPKKQNTTANLLQAWFFTFYILKLLKIKKNCLARSSKSEEDYFVKSEGLKLSLIKLCCLHTSYQSDKIMMEDNELFIWWRKFVPTNKLKIINLINVEICLIWKDFFSHRN